MAAKNRRLYIGISVELRQKQCSIEISATNFGIFDHDDLGKSVSKWSRQRWTTENKTAELAQRTPRDASNIWVPWKVLRVLTTHPATFPEICSRLLFRSILRMCVQKLKFVALPVPEIIGGTQKNLGSRWIRPRSLFSEIFHGLVFGWTLWMYRPNLQSV